MLRLRRLTGAREVGVWALVASSYLGGSSAVPHPDSVRRSPPPGLVPSLVWSDDGRLAGVRDLQAHGGNVYDLIFVEGPF